MAYLRRPDLLLYPSLRGVIPQYYIVLHTPEDFIALSCLPYADFLVLRGPVLCIPEKEEGRAKKRLQEIATQAQKAKKSRNLFELNQNEIPVMLSSPESILAIIIAGYFNNLCTDPDGKLCRACNTTQEAVWIQAKIEVSTPSVQKNNEKFYMSVPERIFMGFGPNGRKA